MKRKKQPKRNGTQGAAQARRLEVQWRPTQAYAVPMPRREPERLEALRGYQVLDTPPEACFDHLTALAAQVCETPIAFISLVDADRQWFKSRIGLRVRETSRSIAFCAHAIMQKDVFVVRDATRDARFAENPLVTHAPGIRFYAGMPLINPEGHALGTLCVVDREPRRLTERQYETLRLLARQAMCLLEQRRHAAETQRRLEQTGQELERLRQEWDALRSWVQTQAAALHRHTGPLRAWCASAAAEGIAARWDRARPHLRAIDQAADALSKQVMRRVRR